MEERKELLKQIGWSDELIEKICSPEYIPTTESLGSLYSITTSEISSTDLNLTLRNPTITSDVYLPK